MEIKFHSYKDFVVNYKLVHKGGHHEVYCNGDTHRKIYGDSVGTEPIGSEETLFRFDDYFCDCKKD